MQLHIHITRPRTDEHGNPYMCQPLQLKQPSRQEEHSPQHDFGKVVTCTVTNNEHSMDILNSLDYVSIHDCGLLDNDDNRDKLQIAMVLSDIR